MDAIQTTVSRPVYGWHPLKNKIVNLNSSRTGYVDRDLRQAVESSNIKRLKMMKIVVDHREKNSGIVELLNRKPTQVSFRQLDYGDYLINDWVTVERKKAEDFLISIIDGRLFRQASGLKKNCLNPIILIEGNPYRTQLKMNKRSVMGALVCLQSIWHLPVAHSSSAAETVEIFRLIGMQTSKNIEALLPRSGYRPSRLITRKLYILQGLPSIGPMLAKRLLVHFGSVTRVMNAKVENLTQVKGIGKETAEGTREILDSVEQNLENGLPQKSMLAD
jgi:Fanconi anemia group M protein